jgi:hypothetical protein
MTLLKQKKKLLKAKIAVVLDNELGRVPARSFFRAAFSPVRQLRELLSLWYERNYMLS